MANFVTVGYGLVTRRLNTISNAVPAVTESDDPWIDVTALFNIPNVGDHTPDEGETFVTDKTALSTAQGHKIAELRDKGAYHIKKRGFLTGLTDPGPPIVNFEYVYASKPIDQSNIEQTFGAAIASTNPDATFSIFCADSGQWVQDADGWAFREHTIGQVKDVANNLYQHIQQAREALVDYVGQVLAATTVDAVNAITWVNPSA